VNVTIKTVKTTNDAVTEIETFDIETPSDAHANVNSFILLGRRAADDDQILRLDRIVLQTSHPGFANGNVTLSFRANGGFVCMLMLSPEVVALLSNKLAASSGRLNQ
jgi:hypothetical protein